MKYTHVCLPYIRKTYSTGKSRTCTRASSITTTCHAAMREQIARGLFGIYILNFNLFVCVFFLSSSIHVSHLSGDVRMELLFIHHTLKRSKCLERHVSILVVVVLTILHSNSHKIDGEIVMMTDVEQSFVRWFDTRYTIRIVMSWPEDTTNFHLAYSSQVIHGYLWVCYLNHRVMQSSVLQLPREMPWPPCEQHARHTRSTTIHQPMTPPFQIAMISTTLLWQLTCVFF